jgi:uncharacterized protein YecE (DUF72 family)
MMIGESEMPENTALPVESRPTPGPCRFGPAGWSYPDWRGTVYPEPAPRGFRPLPFIADRFDFVEVNTTFYRIPEPRLAGGWLTQTAGRDGFLFWIKLYRAFTHDGRLDRAEVDSFRRAVQPLAAAGRLAGLLAQFPYSFHLESPAKRHLAALADCFADLTLAVEFRHAAWNDERVLEWFRRRGLVWVNVDQPDISGNLPLTAAATRSDLAYVRLHGRNAAAWFASSGRDARYDYCYSGQELEHIAAVIRSLQEQARKIFVSGNNHYKGSAVRNLLELKRRLAESGAAASPPGD